MSLISSQELAASRLDSSELGCEVQHSAKRIRIAGGCSHDIGQEHRSMMTCEPSLHPASKQMAFPSMQSLADSPAKTSAMQDSERDWQARGPVFSTNTPGSLASWDQISRSWKTSQRCLIEGWETFSERFPTSGMMHYGTLLPHVPWDTHTCDDECSLWPTPTASMDGRGFGIPLHDRTGRYKLETVSRVHALVKEHGWRIHPNFTEALMGFPTGWSEIEPSETPLRQRSRKRSGVQS